MIFTRVAESTRSNRLTGYTMLVITVLAEMAGLGAVDATPASADPASACHAASPNCAVVPGMKDGYVGQPCSSWTRYVYGFGPRGEILACRSFDGGKSGQWAQGGSLTGVREIGTACSSWQVGQGPDGRPLWCSLRAPTRRQGILIIPTAHGRRSQFPAEVDRQ